MFHIEASGHDETSFVENSSKLIGKDFQTNCSKTGGAGGRLDAIRAVPVMESNQQAAFYYQLKLSCAESRRRLDGFQDHFIILSPFFRQ